MNVRRRWLRSCMYFDPGNGSHKGAKGSRIVQAFMRRKDLQMRAGDPGSIERSLQRVQRQWGLPDFRFVGNCRCEFMRGKWGNWNSTRRSWRRGRANCRERKGQNRRYKQILVQETQTKAVLPEKEELRKLYRLNKVIYDSFMLRSPNTQFAFWAYPHGPLQNSQCISEAFPTLNSA